MSEDQNSMLQQATDSINSGNFEEALERARGILVGDPKNGDAKLIEAISLSQLRNSRDASEAFAEAIRIMPTSVKARFNAAVHEFNCGNVGQAKIFANEASSLDPTHEGTKTLMAQMESDSQMPEGGVRYAREGASSFEPESDGIPMVKKLGVGWLVIGWLISVAGLIVMAISAVNMFAHPVDISNVMNGSTNGDAMKTAMNGTNLMLLFVDIVLRITAITWTVMDIIHRKGSFMWLIGHIPCSCIGLGFITQPLYILFGRK